MIPPVTIHFPDDPFGPSGPSINSNSVVPSSHITDRAAASLAPVMEEAAAVDPGPCGFTFIELEAK